MRDEMLSTILNDLNSSSPDVEASAIISTDGLTIAAMLPQQMDEDRMGAMSAAMLSLGTRTAQELGRGELEQVTVKGKSGQVVMIYAGKEAVLSVLTTPKARLGLVFLDVKRAAENISKIL